MQALNRVMLLGHLGNKPESSVLRNGLAVSRFRLALNERWRDKETGEQKTHTEWFRVVLYGKTAELANQFCDKGSCVYVGGKLKTRRYQDNNKADRFITEVYAHEIIFLDQRSTEHDDNPSTVEEHPSWITDLTQKHRLPV